MKLEFFENENPIWRYVFDDAPLNPNIPLEEFITSSDNKYLLLRDGKKEITIENSTVNIAIFPTSVSYYRDVAQQGAQADRACTHEWLASTLPDVLCVCSRCGEITPRR